MKKKSIAGLFAFAAAVIMGGGLLLPVLAENSLRNEAEKVHEVKPEKESGGDLEQESSKKENQKQEEQKQENQKQDNQKQEDYNQEDSGKEIPFSKEQAEPFMTLGKQFIQEKLDVPFLESVRLAFHQADDKGGVSLTWRGLESDAVSPEESSYYSVGFENADIEKGTGTVHTVGASGSVIQETVRTLQEEGRSSLLTELSDAPSPENVLYPSLDWVDGSKRLHLLWTNDNFDLGYYTYHEVTYEQVNEDCTSGELVYLHSLRTKMQNVAVMENLSEEKNEELKIQAEEYASDLGYDIDTYVESYVFGDTINFVFTVKDSRFSQVGLALNIFGDLCGRAVGDDVMEYALMVHRDV